MQRKPSTDELMAACERVYRKRVRRKLAIMFGSFSLGVSVLLWAVTR